MVIKHGNGNDGTKGKGSKICRTTNRIRDHKGFTGNLSKTDALQIKNKENSIMNRDGSGFHLLLNRSRIQSEIWLNSWHKITEGYGRSIRKGYVLADKDCYNQRLSIRFGADCTRNVRVNWNISRSDNSLLVHAEIWRNRCARDNERWWKVDVRGAGHCQMSDGGKIKPLLVTCNANNKTVTIISGY